MYKLGKDVDLNFLNGAVVEQICASSSAIIINLDRMIRLTILSDFAVGNSTNDLAHYNGSAADASALFPLLGGSISGAAATDLGGLLLRIGVDTYLEIFDSSEHYESFWIANGDDLIVV